MQIDFWQYKLGQSSKFPKNFQVMKYIFKTDIMHNKCSFHFFVKYEFECIVNSFSTLDSTIEGRTNCKYSKMYMQISKYF